MFIRGVVEHTPLKRGIAQSRPASVRDIRINSCPIKKAPPGGAYTYLHFKH